ncbi:unnamed protein product, partial [Nesidiocoris tenuis]
MSSIIGCLCCKFVLWEFRRRISTHSSIRGEPLERHAVQAGANRQSQIYRTVQSAPF